MSPTKLCLKIRTFTLCGQVLKGKAGYWTTSVIVSVLESITGLLMTWDFFISGTSLHDAYPNINPQTIGEFLLQLSSSVIIFFPDFGEEFCLSKRRRRKNPTKKERRLLLKNLRFFCFNYFSLYSPLFCRLRHISSL